MPNQSDPIYCPENVLLFETLYGKNLISLGGTDAIENLFSDYEIKKLTAMDLGFGLGGVAYYLSEKYDMKIYGVEVPQWMAEYATQHAPPHLQQQLIFSTYDEAGLIPFDSNSFDIVYSKGVLNHVKNKLPVFQEVKRLLKPNGLFIIADWIFPLSEINNSDPLVRETKESYEKVLRESGFNEIIFRDDSVHFIRYAENFIKNLIANKKLIEENYGEEIFNMILKQHQELLVNMSNKNKFAVRIIAKTKE